MASPAYERILELQALDLNLMQLRHRHANHPARTPVAELESEQNELNASAAELADRKSDLERQRKRFEDEAAMVQDRRNGIDQKLYGGEVTASKELLALQDEAASLKQQQTQIEDQELELMEQLDTLNDEENALGSRETELQARLGVAQSDLADQLAALDSEIETLVSDRTTAAAAADGALVEQYEALRPQYDGVAVARLVNGSCDGCHIHLSAVAIDQLMKLPEDAVVNCEECGRMLVR